MSQTGHIHSINASVKITTTGGGSISLSGHGNSTDIDFNADDLEATAYGDQSHTFLQGLTNWTITVNGWWAGSHATDVSESVAACVHNLLYKSSASEVMVWVNSGGSTSGSISYVGCANVQAAPVGFPADGIATMNITFTSRAGSLTACADSIW